MKLLGSLSVFPALPDRLERLPELVFNMWWSWSPEALNMFETIDPVFWDQTNHNPVKLLRLVSPDRLQELTEDAEFLVSYDAVMTAFDVYMNPKSTWYSRTYPDRRNEVIAYFSAEFGLHESLPIYSGGLGVLAGDHCKSASDLGLPFIGVGFLYPQGYFTQQIDDEGMQEAIYVKLEFAEAPALPALDAHGNEIMISVQLPGRSVYAKVWRIQVGRIPLYLLDTDVNLNAADDRELAARLYGGNMEMRVAQEIVLGIGGVRALRTLDIHPTIFHMNEGHAAFLSLETCARVCSGTASQLFPGATGDRRQCRLYDPYAGTSRQRRLPVGNDGQILPFVLGSVGSRSLWFHELGMLGDPLGRTFQHDRPGAAFCGICQWRKRPAWSGRG